MSKRPVEQDADKLLELAQEINRLLSDKEERLKNLRSNPNGEEDINLLPHPDAPS